MTDWLKLDFELIYCARVDLFDMNASGALRAAVPARDIAAYHQPDAAPSLTSLPFLGRRYGRFQSVALANETGS